MTPQEFSARYWAAQPIPVRELAGLDQLSDERTAKAWELARMGYAIDPDIMMRGGDPYWVQFVRLANGYTRYPGLGTKTVLAVPGAWFPSTPGYEPYDALHPQAGSLKVSLDLADYPEPQKPDEPAPIVPDVPQAPNWALRCGSWCEAHALDHSPDGFLYEGVDGKWRKTVVSSPFGGLRQYWQKVG